LYGRIVGLRPVEPDDQDFLRELANHPQVRANVVGWDWPSARPALSAVQPLSVVLAATGQIVGHTGLGNVDWQNQSATTRIELMPGLAPKGTGTDAIMTLMAWAFYEVGLRRLHGTCLDFNVASHGAYVRKCGWQIEGREREAVFRHGRWNDLLHVAILKREFDTLLDAEEYVGRLTTPMTAPTLAPLREPVPAPELASIWQDLASAS
jgi:RimJ/RimL family protein N-acetyltransferase